MGFVSFVGRVLFASVFLLSAYQEFNEFGVDGGPAAKELKPKFDLMSKNIHAHLGFHIAEIEMKHVIAGALSLKGLGGVLFIFGSTLGANLLALYLAIVTPIVFDFYNYDVEKPEFVQLFVKFTRNLALFGSLLFFLGMKNSSPRRTSREEGPQNKDSVRKELWDFVRKIVCLDDCVVTFGGASASIRLQGALLFHLG